MACGKTRPTCNRRVALPYNHARNPALHEGGSVLPPQGTLVHSFDVGVPGTTAGDCFSYTTLTRASTHVRAGVRPEDISELVRDLVQRHAGATSAVTAFSEAPLRTEAVSERGASAVHLAASPCRRALGAR